MDGQGKVGSISFLADYENTVDAFLKMLISIKINQRVRMKISGTNKANVKYTDKYYSKHNPLLIHRLWKYKENHVIL